MDFKNLNLDQHLLEETLFSIIEKLGEKHSCKKSTDTTKKKVYQFTVDERSGIIEFYYKSNGTTTINYKVGKDRELSQEVAQKISDELVIDERNTFSILVSGINEDLYELFISYLLEEHNSEIIDEDSTDSYFLKKIKSDQRDVLTIKYYSNKNLQLQGKPIVLYKEAIYFLSEFLDKKKIVEIQKEYFKCDIDSSNIDNEFDEVFKKSGDFLDDRLKETILKHFYPR